MVYSLELKTVREWGNGGNMGRKWLMLVVAFFSVFSFLFAMQSLPPVIPQIMEEFNVSHAETSLLMSLVALPVIFLSLPAGILTVKWGPKRVSGLGLILATFGALTTYLANSFLWLEIGRLILGIGGALVAVSAISIIPQWFSREELGKAMGIYAINMPIVTITALNLLPRIASGFGWRTSFLIATIILAAAALANISLIRGNHRRRNQSQCMLASRISKYGL
ncbi:hypothetical protein AKJ47_01570 [candidate division MSBL1 archaeon SCGC-AAA261G05]|uniref:Major facilitator superfamily (MFS) profile domain-containing protein n=2 Tax=candidate division MSBL1 TaxID=215777 RepID=A0A133VBP2_9EURY|nr:hypothetical protein AKJ47_01570 [candidate division MSBL1 archaeon SCGC-AAA261G05]KXB04540.1 hypothetical protein AKJ48_02215 [candidate division MSBL1 archaeon SCGC-AAA261O19]